MPLSPSQAKVIVPGFFYSNFAKVCTFLNRLVSREDYGFRYRRRSGRCEPVHCNRKDEIIAYKTHQRAWLSGITREKYGRHFSGDDTFYFTGNEYADEMLVKVDIDCHGRGTAEGARACAEWLKANVFPGLFYEPSTNGNGIHGYLILRKKGKTAAQVNEWLRRLEDDLQAYQHQFDIELIEIKGQCRELVYADRRLIDVKCGQLAKLPREIVQRWDEFQKTTRLDFDTFTFPDIQAAERKPPAVNPPGSLNRKHVRHWERLRELAGTMLGSRSKQVGGQLVVTTDDLAVLIAILCHCAKDMNADGSMPTARIKALWETMYKAGDCERQFNPKRYKAARNILEQCGVICWKSVFYCPHTHVAAKWTLEQWFVEQVTELLTEEESRESSFVVGEVLDRLTWKPEDEITAPEPYWQVPLRLPDGYEMLEHLALAA